MRMAWRMGNREVLHVISCVDDSMIVAQVHETRLMRKYKYFLSFESFRGELHYSADHPERSRLTIDIDTASVVCRDRSLKEHKQRRLAEYVRDVALNAAAHPSIQFSSCQISAKPLRGLVVEGVLNLCGTTRPLKMNAIFHPSSTESIDIEADLAFKLSEFGIKAPSSLFGMVETNDQVLIHLQMRTARKS
jgi:polyisoprenoid-binding protein YceI